MGECCGERKKQPKLSLLLDMLSLIQVFMSTTRCSNRTEASCDMGHWFDEHI